MTSVDILSDKIQQHFRHPIYCVLYGKDIITVGQMIKLNDSELKSIRNFGVTAMSKVTMFRQLVDTANTLLANQKNNS